MFNPIKFLFKVQTVISAPVVVSKNRTHERQTVCYCLNTDQIFMAGKVNFQVYFRTAKKL